MVRSGTQRAVATSASVQAQHEAAERAEIRAKLARGEMSMADAQRQLLEMVLHRTADMSPSVQARLREKLEHALQTDPYLRLARGAPEVDEA